MKICVHKFEPTTETCIHCGYRPKPLGLFERFIQWILCEDE